jgi:hypothetical protein
MKNIIIVSISFALLCVVFVFCNILYKKTIIRDKPYIDRFNYLQKNHDKINNWLSESHRSKVDIITRLGLPYNDPNENCWVWIPVSRQENLGQSILNCDYGHDGFFLILESKNKNQARLRTISGNWELFQRIIDSIEYSQQHQGTDKLNPPSDTLLEKER